MRLWRGIPVVFLLGLLLFPMTVGAAGPPDQQQTVSDGASLTVHGMFPSKIGHSAAQTFTAGKTGVLYQVDLLFSYTGKHSDSFPMCVSVEITGPGIPTGPSVPSGTHLICDSDHSTTPQWVSVPLAAPSAAGSVYTITLIRNGTDNNPAMWYGTATDTYSKGQWSWSTDYYSHSWDNHWSVQLGDAAFKTYVLTKDGCKDGGWKQVTSLGFKNQGQCMKYVKDHS